MKTECYQCKVMLMAKDVLTEEVRADIVNRESCRNMVMWCDKNEIEVGLREREYAYGVV